MPGHRFSLPATRSADAAGPAAEARRSPEGRKDGRTETDTGATKAHLDATKTDIEKSNTAFVVPLSLYRPPRPRPAGPATI